VVSEEITITEVGKFPRAQNSQTFSHHKPFLCAISDSPG